MKSNAKFSELLTFGRGEGNRTILFSKLSTVSDYIFIETPYTQLKSMKNILVYVL